MFIPGVFSCPLWHEPRRVFLILASVVASIALSNLSCDLCIVGCGYGAARARPCGSSSTALCRAWALCSHSSPWPLPSPWWPRRVRSTLAGCMAGWDWLSPSQVGAVMMDVLCDECHCSGVHIVTCPVPGPGCACVELCSASIPSPWPRVRAGVLQPLNALIRPAPTPRKNARKVLALTLPAEPECSL